MAHSSHSLHQSNQQLERITFAFLVLPWLFVLLRVWTRSRIISNFGWDDSTMVLAVLIFSVYSGSQLHIEANGGGTHITSISHLQKLVKWVVVSEAAYCATMAILKLSLGIFFARIVAKRWQLILIYITVGVNIVSSTSAFFYVIFRCGSNIDAYMIQQLSGQCTPEKLDVFMSYQQASFTTITDLVFILLPILLLWNANMHPRSKISAGFILSLGALGCICSMIRFKYVDGLTHYDDFFWNTVQISIWSTIEAGVGIIAGCLATLRPLLRFIAASASRSDSSLYGCVRKITSSFASSSKSAQSELPRFNVSASGEQDSTKDDSGTELSYIDFPMPPSHIVTMSSNVGTKRESTDCILPRHHLSNLPFPQPASSNPSE